MTYQSKTAETFLSMLFSNTGDILEIGSDIAGEVVSETIHKNPFQIMLIF